MIRLSVVVAILCLISTFSVRAEPIFVVQQSMTYKDKIDLSSFGVPFATIIYESSLLPENGDQPYDGVWLEQIAAKLTKGSLPVILDVERWKVYTTDKTKRKEATKKFINVITGIRNARPDLKFAFYSVVPYQTYWSYKNPNEARQRRAWRELDKFAKQDLVPHVDAIFPSLYTRQMDPEVWRKNAEETLIAAKKFNKPVYCFLWPQYWREDRLGVYIPPEYWRVELETCKKLSDGIVIWNYDPNRKWDSTAPWWLETLNFMKSYGL